MSPSSRDPLLAVEGLSVHVGRRALLREVSFCLRPGESLTLLGESGAGKSLMAQAVIGNLPAALTAGGSVLVDGRRSRADDHRARRALWGRSLALLPQEPALALDPLMRVARQWHESLSLVRGMGSSPARATTAEGLRAAGLRDAGGHYPWQLSGGMAQRAAAGIAMAGGARVLLADEPTKGLDAHWRDRTVELLQSVQRAGGCVVVITHDLRVARALGGQLMVLRGGEVVEHGGTEQVLARPTHAFTRQLIAADPAHWPIRTAPAPGGPLLEARALSKRYGSQVLFDAVDLRVRGGERLSVQGPSGTGKSTLGNVLLGLSHADHGTLHRADGLSPTAFQKLYQDPAASFAPRASLRTSLRDVALRHGAGWNTVEQRLERLGVAGDLLARRPSEVSGGELQRIALARVLITRPALLFADEPTSRLDPVTQQQGMAVLLDALDDSGAALLLVTHDEDIARAVGGATLRLGARQQPAAMAA
ncbi:ABC transporter ATP-binding protein [Xylophilus sp. GOD-11R]|uniref:ABC transporter ATP-binding protein n=1 Tax=Xylophilus sp. GOD-11R TaxID=3089814 RepID=UPI00298D0AE7|nr:ATP-binding cassette domain-containing protein [Xylophilus sp. GOD-11R]WPB56059.1 ATP-binding cassette domain-containing protein [Xylophilus sp. GOD-11R]